MLRILGERLKARVFEDIFPHFARGYIEYLRTQPPIRGNFQGALLPVTQQLALKQEPDEAFRRQVFQGTLTFLYRLLFLLYAESRGLLPVKEERGYWEHSLARIKDEIAVKAGQIVDEAPKRIIKGYSDQSTAIYDRLMELFGHIDQGSREMNVPLYNGGLFISKPELGDNSPEAENAQFLLAYKIPDRYLALGLDLLTRDEDSKRHDLVFIDYKSLGVRQLGSIYEGLLEFKIRVAPEKMAVVQGKKTEEVVFYHEAVETGRKILTTGRGKIAVERVYLQGDVYLENDRRERKATGSYYTPDHIVKYIVQNTVGPILEEKFEKLRVIFREAQQAYRNAEQRAAAFRKRGMAPDDPAKTANSYSHLVNELFDLKVLDPAMGSGHFLVEAVDFICDRILGQKEGFLQAFPWNPVTTFLEQTRREILAGMERQGVTIDTSRLTDINLLKRHVLKRCIYGVDLNPMAVELAKVSLWLDCFTLGAPLSFLNHHLKCGNSLIGTTVQEVEAELAAQKKGHSGTLWGGPFQGLLSGTSTMLELARTPDVTIEEAEQSKKLFKSFEDGMAPYKAALDIWVSRFFGNKLAQEYLTLVGQDYIEEIRSGGKGLSPTYREVISKAKGISGEKRFFHWDLEFPEAFIDLERKDWKLKEQQGFDAVVGNPPFVDKKHIATELGEEDQYWQRSKQFVAARGIYDLYMLFVQLGIDLSRLGARSCLLTPLPWLTQSEGEPLRDFLLSAGSLSIFDFSAEPYFKDALVKVIGVHVTRATSTDNIEIRGGQRPRIVPSVEVRRLFGGQIRIDVDIDYLSILEKIVSHSVSLSTIYTPTFGLRASSKERGGFTKDQFIKPKDNCRNPVPYLESRELSRKGIVWSGRWLDYRPDEIYSARSPELFLNPKLLLPSLLSRKIIRVAYDDKGFFADQSLVCISPCFQLPILPDPATEYRPSLKNLQRQLNSEVTSFFFGNCVVGEALGGGAIHATPGLVARLRVFLDPGLENEYCDHQEVIARICEFTDEERAAIHCWFAEETGGTD